MTMNIACHDFNWIPWANRRKETLDLERVLAEMASAGYTAVEFSRVPMEVDDPARTARLLRKHGLKLTGMSLYVGGRPGQFEAAKAQARLCAEWGGEKAVLFDPIDWKALGSAGLDGLHGTIEFIEHMAAYAETLGLDPVFHNHLHTNVETPAQIDEIVPQFRCAGLCLDTGHLIAAGGDPVACIRRYARQIRHVHFKDSLFKSDGTFDQFVELGEGGRSRPEDWLAALREVGYDGWLILEQDHTRTTPLESAKADLKWLREHGL